MPGYTGYSASKAGLLGLVRSFAARAERRLQVNAICPGWVDADGVEELDGIAAATGRTREDAFRDAMREVPLGRMSQPKDVAGTVAWLLSDDARGVTGQAIDQTVELRWGDGKPAATERCHLRDRARPLRLGTSQGSRSSRS